MKRESGIDATRGIVMVIMALDHVRDFMHKSSMTQDPTDLKTTTAALFFTRWITHLCAPTFVFLAGISAYISFRRKNNLRESRLFLLTRGIWLLLLEFTVISFALWFDIRFSLLLMEVIAAIGLSFIVLALMLKLPSRLIGMAGILLIIIQNILQFVPAPEDHVMNFFFAVLSRPSLIRINESHSFFSAYPLLPWLGIMLTGFAAGEIFELPSEKRKKVLLRTALIVLSTFLVLRAINIFGDASGWSSQKSPLFTILSFLNVTKYPASLLFTLLFTGIALLLLYFTENRKNSLSGFFEVYGRVPFFYFVTHLYIIHGAMLIMLFIQGFSTGELAFGAFRNGRPGGGGGVTLGTVYIIWVSVVLLLYPLCRWYGNYKTGHPEKKLLKYI